MTIVTREPIIEGLNLLFSTMARNCDFKAKADEHSLSILVLKCKQFQHPAIESHELIGSVSHEDFRDNRLFQRVHEITEPHL